MGESMPRDAARALLFLEVSGNLAVGQQPP